MVYVILSSIIILLFCVIDLSVLLRELTSKRRMRMIISLICLLTILYNIYASIPQMDLILSVVLKDRFPYNINHHTKMIMTEMNITAINAPFVCIANISIMLYDLYSRKISD